MAPPAQRMHVYATFSETGSVHLIDAKANRCVQAWSHDELYGPATPLDLAHADNSSSADEMSDEDSDETEGVLSWSKDGCRLAVSFCSLTCSSSSSRCSVLQFSDNLA